MAEICHLNRELLQSLYDKLNGGLFYENHDEDMALVGQLRLALAATPKTPRLAIMAVAQQVCDALEADRKSEGYDLEAGMFGPAFSNLLRKWAALEYAAQPANGRPTFATEAEGDAYTLGWFEGQGWGFPTPRDASTIHNAHNSVLNLKLSVNTSEANSVVSSVIKRLKDLREYDDAEHMSSLAQPRTTPSYLSRMADATPLLNAVDKVLNLMGLKHTPECLELRLKELDAARKAVAK